MYNNIFLLSVKPKETYATRKQAGDKRIHSELRRLRHVNQREWRHREQTDDIIAQIAAEIAPSETRARDSERDSRHQDGDGGREEGGARETQERF